MTDTSNIGASTAEVEEIRRKLAEASVELEDLRE